MEQLETILRPALSNCAGMKSDQVLTAIRPQLEALDFEVERSKKKIDKVFFGGYEVDAVHRHRPEGAIWVEVEGGRATESNAVHRNVVRAMSVDKVAELVLIVPEAYRHSRGVAPSADITRAMAHRLEGRVQFRISVIGY